MKIPKPKSGYLRHINILSKDIINIVLELECSTKILCRISSLIFISLCSNVAYLTANYDYNY